MNSAPSVRPNVRLVVYNIILSGLTHYFRMKLGFNKLMKDFLKKHSFCPKLGHFSVQSQISEVFFQPVHKIFVKFRLMTGIKKWVKVRELDF